MRHAIGTGMRTGTISREELRSDKGYTFDPARIALVLVDQVTADTTRDSAFAKHLEADGIDTGYFFDRLEQVAIPNQLRLLERFRELGSTCVFTRPLIMLDDAGDWPSGYRKEVAAMGLPPIRPGVGSFDFHPAFELADSDFVVDKCGVSAFHGGNLAAVLRNRDVAHVAVTGCTTNYGVGNNAIDAANLGFEVTIVEDAAAAVSDEVHVAWLAMHDLFYQCQSADEILARLNGSVSGKRD